MITCFTHKLLFPVVYTSIYGIGTVLSKGLSDGAKIKLGNSTRKMASAKWNYTQTKKCLLFIQGSRKISPQNPFFTIIL